MKTLKLDKMVCGWFVGKFSPTALQTDVCEVAVKKYSKGQKEDKHFHKIATEVTLILSGVVIMMDQRLETGNIIVIEPEESTSFEALEDTITVVVKVPGARNDKYLS